MSRTRLWIVAVVMVVSATLASPGAQQDPGGPPPVIAPQLPSLLGQQQGPVRKYTGELIDVDYQDADLRQVLTQLAEAGRLNLVIDPSVPTNAKVGVKLRQVPWDQALEVVLKLGQLGFEIEGNVVRVVSADVLKKEIISRQEIADARAEAQAKESVTARTYSLNYAKGSDLERILKSSVLSKNGNTNFDERTNTMVVYDIPQRLDLVTDLIARLDQPELQVEIHAKIVQTSRDSAKALGVQWGFNGRLAPELGNTTGMAFPNNGSVSGRAVDSGGKAASQGANDPRASATNSTGTGVNLGVPTATSGIGLAMGAINGAFNLDVALTALEHSGKGKIISEPHVTTQNNKEAEVTQGFQIPFQTTSNNTTTVQFKDAALKLTVTPQITSANTVILRIVLENGTPDFGKAVNGNPAIRTDRASTQVQVSDGQTTVIGGINSSSETTANDSTPGMSRVPILGWLFKRNNNTASSQELMIFITPRIIRGLP